MWIPELNSSVPSPTVQQSPPGLSLLGLGPLLFECDGPRKGPQHERENRQDIDLDGGPGRTRTCNQTVMSGRL